MVFFDFLYCSIHSFYASYKEKGAEATSVAIVAALQTINVMTVVMLFQFLVDEKSKTSKLLAIAIFIALDVYNYRRYLYQSAYSAKSIEARWLEKPEPERKRIKSQVVFYGVFSAIVFIGLAIFIGSRR